MKTAFTIILAVCVFTLAACDKQKQITLRGFPASPFFSEFDYDPLPIDGIGGNLVPSNQSWICETRGASGRIIAPLRQYPESEHRLIYTYIDKKPLPSTDRLWELVLRPFKNPKTPEIDWNVYKDLPNFRYGEYNLPNQYIGRIWIEISPSPENKTFGLHLRMIEQPINFNDKIHK